MINRIHHFYAKGKLLLSGEYAVLRGALALVLPLQYGQSMTVEEIRTTCHPKLEWEARERNGIWFTATYHLPDFTCASTSAVLLAKPLSRILQALNRYRPDFFSGSFSWRIRTNLEFDRNWGWGSSSTLLRNLAAWVGADPYSLNAEITGGSGYDIAAAVRDRPFVYGLSNKQPTCLETSFNPEFHNQLLFVYLGNKQTSASEVAAYSHQIEEDPMLTSRISQITNALCQVSQLEDFEKLLREHESLIARHIRAVPVAEGLFHDYPYVVKSLGAWGGDFVVCTHRGNRAQVEDYLRRKGLNQWFAYQDIVSIN